MQFVLHEIVKPGMVKMTETEKADVAGADMVVGCCWSVVVERERES
jgi:hypothetical protein